MRRTATLWLLAVLTWPISLGAIGFPAYITLAPEPGSFPLVEGLRAAPLWVDSADWPGVVRAVSDLEADIHRVTAIRPETRRSVSSRSPYMVIIGTVGRSRLIDQLAADGKIDVSGIEGRWESFFIETVAEPLPGVESALVIAGSDKRGTIYGVYDLSEQIGVSPWYWWADVVPDHRDALYVTSGKYQQGEPSVKYRGIFLNDERPDLDYWVRYTYGEYPDPSNPDATVANFNSDFYARIFEVILRMKGNYLWPAMWNNAFAEDDAENARLADEYGIVMGTSHQEPMMRAQKEWDWHLGQELGNWNFATHEDELTAFWRKGVDERSEFENLYTMGLRGENDTAMVQGREESMRLLERIVEIQRGILAEEVNPDVTRVPQVWTLYKEVQGYYENGLRVPDDVTLLWAEDNWGNVRRLPTVEERDRAGGAGVYYHFDYHGGPRSYQWLNTNPIAKVWDQMSLAKNYGADRIWIVNVGHFKGYEFPMEYFLSLAWNTDRWDNESIGEFTRLWAAREFGETFADDAAAIVSRYSKYNGRRKPELLRPDTYSLVHYQEAETVVADYNALVARAESLYERLPDHKRDAFYQLALFPAKASAQVNELYLAAGLNQLYAEQGRASTNDMADRVRELFQADQDLMAHFNDDFAGGKWNHFMDQSHIGYTSWRDPPADSLDAIELRDIEAPDQAVLGIAVQGDRLAWPGVSDAAPELPEFDSLQRRRQYIDVFNRGLAPFEFSSATSAPWIILSEAGGTIDQDKRVWVSLDWARVPPGRSSETVRISGAGETVEVRLTTFNPVEVTRETLNGFVESQGVVSMEAEHFTSNIASGSNRWIRIEDYGHTLSGMRADGPVDVLATPQADSPALEYQMYLFNPGELTADLIVAPTLNFLDGRAVRVAVSFDDDSPQIVELVGAGYDAQNGNRDWEQSVRDNSRTVTTAHTVESAGYHTLKVWMVDPAVIVQKLVVRTPAAPNAETYLGPPESFRRQ